MNNAPDVPTLQGLLQQGGFAFVDALTMRGLIDPRTLADWSAFTASWNDLGQDDYLAARGRQRRRRHAVFTVTADGYIERAPSRPHYQSLQNNPLQGGIERWFTPVEAEIADGASVHRILDACRELFGEMAPHVRRWLVELHQFRIEARAGQAGEPTPEGAHRDGVDYVLVLLIERCNIASGTTTIHAPDGRLLGDFTLTRPLDASLVDDVRVFHAVTPVTPLDPARPAHRDVLVVTFKAAV